MTKEGNLEALTVHVESPDLVSADRRAQAGRELVHAVRATVWESEYD